MRRKARTYACLPGAGGTRKHQIYMRATIELTGEEENDSARTFEGRTLSAFTLPEEEDPDIGSVLFELCALCAKLLVNGIADTLG